MQPKIKSSAETLEGFDCIAKTLPYHFHKKGTSCCMNISCMTYLIICVIHVGFWNLKGMGLINVNWKMSNARSRTFAPLLSPKGDVAFVITIGLVIHPKSNVDFKSHHFWRNKSRTKVLLLALLFLHSSFPLNLY
jgi:hypothetical protein